MQSKVDFFVGLIAFFFTQLAGIVFLYLIFEHIPNLNGWSFEQLLFIYGFAQLPRGIDHLFTDYIWMLAMRMVIRGEFDKYLLRPINPLFQLIAERFQPDAIGEILVGMILVVTSCVKMEIKIGFFNSIVFVVSIVAGAIIYTAIKLFFASIAFWTKDSIGLLQLVYETADFAKYPVSIYDKKVRFILSYIFPFAFVAFYPASYFIGKAKLLTTVGIEVLIAIITITIAYATFNKGLTIYESAGN
jgi:ABC-2 type transport system permease protein